MRRGGGRWKEIKENVLKLTHHKTQTESLSTVLKIQLLGTVLKIQSLVLQKCSVFYPHLVLNLTDT